MNLTADIGYNVKFSLSLSVSYLHNYLTVILLHIIICLCVVAFTSVVKMAAQFPAMSAGKQICLLDQNSEKATGLQALAHSAGKISSLRSTKHNIRGIKCFIHMESQF